MKKIILTGGGTAGHVTPNIALMPKLKEEKPSDEDILNEEMTRILQPIDDPETAKEVSEYKNDEEDE